MKTIGSNEVKARLAELLDAASRGEHVTITRRGVALAELGPPSARQRSGIRGTIEAIRAFRSDHRLGERSVAELVGRRDV